MYARRTIATALLLILTEGLSGAKPTQEEYRQFRGSWSGPTASMVVRLDITGGGEFHWTASSGQALAEGSGRVRKEGTKYLIELPFIQREPLLMRLADKSKLLKLLGQDGVVIALSRT